MDNATNAKPKQGVAQMQEVAGSTGQVGGTPGVLPGGLYRHPVTGVELITVTDPLYGDPQSRAAERVGFEYVGPAPEGSIKTVASASDDHASQPTRAVEAQDSYNKGLEARLNALESRNAQLEAEKASGNPVPGTEPVPGSEQTKAAAAEQNEVRTGVRVNTETGDVEKVGHDHKTNESSADEPTHKELQAQAKKLGVSSKGSTEELTQRVAEANAEKVNK